MCSSRRAYLFLLTSLYNLDLVHLFIFMDSHHVAACTYKCNNILFIFVSYYLSRPDFQYNLTVSIVDLFFFGSFPLPIIYYFNEQAMKLSVNNLFGFPKELVKVFLSTLTFGEEVPSQSGGVQS